MRLWARKQTRDGGEEEGGGTAGFAPFASLLTEATGVLSSYSDLHENNGSHRGGSTELGAAVKERQAAHPISRKPRTFPRTGSPSTPPVVLQGSENTGRKRRQGAGGFKFLAFCFLLLEHRLQPTPRSPHCEWPRGSCLAPAQCTVGRKPRLEQPSAVADDPPKERAFLLASSYLTVA